MSGGRITHQRLVTLPRIISRQNLSDGSWDIWKSPFIPLNISDTTRNQYNSKSEMPDKFFPILNLAIYPYQFVDSMQETMDARGSVIG
jgi:hypothetical protein